jgi:hypothetical protein
MANCPNCKTKLGCSCKLRKAADGKQCCVSCVAKHNNVTVNLKKKDESQPSSAPGPIINVTAIQKE